MHYFVVLRFFFIAVIVNSHLPGGCSSRGNGIMGIYPWSV
jgi:hypothetical protein